jgi:hypothetical protein
MDNEKWEICTDEAKIQERWDILKTGVERLVFIWMGSAEMSSTGRNPETIKMDYLFFRAAVEVYLAVALTGMVKGCFPTNTKILHQVVCDNHEFITKLGNKLCQDLKLDYLPVQGKGGS